MEKTYLVISVIQSRCNFRWIEEEDTLWYSGDEIVAKIKKPQPVNSRDTIHVLDMVIYLNFSEKCSAVDSVKDSVQLRYPYVTHFPLLDNNESCRNWISNLLLSAGKLGSHLKMSPQIGGCNQRPGIK
ncbi:hypothetical protein FQR65_LT10688 [Abscondita terminalis]|nr:hypothetical protein FQR65_LT10688 [Abscondita terminalis]